MPPGAPPPPGAAPPGAGLPYGGQSHPGGGTAAWPPYPAELSANAQPGTIGPWAPPGGGYGSPPGGEPPSRGAASRVLVYLVVAVLAAAVGAGAVFALRGSGGPAPSVSSKDIPKPPAHSTGSGSGNGGGSVGGINQTAVAKKVEPGMVDITSKLKLRGEVFEGTGMILTSSGLVLTNNHVVSGATASSLHARLVANNKTYAAQVVGWDETDDVALLQLKGASGLKTVQVGNSATLKLDQPVVALGNAGGVGGTPKVTQGIITNLNRSIRASDSGSGTSESLHNMLQTSAQIAPGDSGGPLANAEGQVIGMNTAANTANLPTQDAQGYSIPINRALNLTKAMAAGQASKNVHIGAPPFIGIAIASTGSNTATSTSTSPNKQLKQLNSIATANHDAIDSSGRCLPNQLASPVPGSIAPASTGALVGAVFCGTPAAASSLQAGDVIVAVNGKPVTSAASLHSVISAFHPGNTVQITWVDLGGKQHTGPLTLAAGPVS